MFSFTKKILFRVCVFISRYYMNYTKTAFEFKKIQSLIPKKTPFIEILNYELRNKVNSYPNK